ncbi:MAG TPA: hypothetical protein VNP96_07650 [Solirubrobacterales bacterium]|nr:hypothetical protein [Solirubrobacterales bacterium]
MTLDESPDRRRVLEQEEEAEGREGEEHGQRSQFVDPAEEAVGQGLEAGGNRGAGVSVGAFGGS